MNDSEIEKALAKFREIHPDWTNAQILEWLSRAKEYLRRREL